MGLEHLKEAEDIVSETFLLATESWRKKGVPDHPTAWLYTVARHQVSKYFIRNKLFSTKVIPVVKAEMMDNTATMPDDLTSQQIKDSQLQMMFAICDPAIIAEAQIGLALRILSGFGIDEIAEAFLTNKETINKRLFRAKEKLRAAQVKMEMPGDQEIGNRLDNVLRIIYLIFNEGYYSSTQNQTLRKDLCVEALRLGIMLTEFERTNLPKTNALMALMCYHSSRLNARQSAGSLPVLFEEQNRELWDRQLIGKGNYFLALSGRGQEITLYHLEARIAYCHAEQPEGMEKWEKILILYDQLLQINDSPSAALNRIYALFKVKGPLIALREMDILKLENNHFYFTLLGELYRTVDVGKAKAHFAKAYALAKTESDRQVLLRKINSL
jgi:RNA polymerase sigma-70 factor (ECF subfamily)